MDAVIDLGAAVLDDTSVVELPRRSISTDRERTSLVSPVEHLFFISRLGDVRPRVDNIEDVGRVELALSVFGGVRVRGERVLSSGLFEVVVGSIGPTSVTSVGSGVAVNNLLHGEVVELASVEESIRFDGFGGRESPARSALSLVVDGGDGVLRSPVIRFWDFDVLEDSVIFVSFSRERSVGMEGLWHKVRLGKFFWGQVREFGDSISGRWISFLETGSELQVFSEDSISGLVFRSLVGLVVLRHKVQPSLLVSKDDREEDKK